MPYQKVTPIDALPELEQVDTKVQQAEESVKRFVRNTHKPSMMFEQRTPTPTGGMPMGGMPPPYRPVELEIESKEYVMPVPQQTCNCVDVLNHAKNCPICMKFYNNDNTVYLIIIAILAVVCILLLKKVLDI